MKTIFISTGYLQDSCLASLHPDEAFNKLLNEYAIMESQIIYFSAGEGCIKEILIKKEPTYSV
ncbi:MAG: hypothetical protein LBT84_04795 [Spirochaetia bacterium]|jgi:hypothetical protein|nr:hypothetical protein [Spirochaetia bacterium]